MRKTLYIIADGGRARFVERTEAGAFRTLKSVESTDIHRKSRELRRAPPSRIHESASPARHALDSRMDERDRAEEIFIKMVAGMLEEEGFASHWKNIVLVLPSRLLKQFWKAMHQDAAARVRQTVSKDLTKVPDHDLEAHLPVFSARFETGSNIPW